MPKNICVYCSSSDAIDFVYFQSAIELGKEFSIRKHTLIYGGTTVGLMGQLARTLKENGGRIIGVIPETIRDKGITNHNVDELIVTKDLRERKSIMDTRADAFIAMPGGFGTLEEVMEILTLKQLQIHNKPVVFLNIRGFYNPLQSLFEHYYHQKFAKPNSDSLYFLASDVSSALTYLEEYKPATIPSKWF